MLKRGFARFLAGLRGSTVDYGLRGLRSKLRAIDACEPELKLAGDRDLKVRAMALRDRVRSGAAVDFDREDLRGPASTGTYIVNDTPFEGTIIRLDRLLLARRER